MAQEKLPSCDQTLVSHSTSQYEKLLLQKGTPILKSLCYSSGEREREIKALLECRKVMSTNYIFHELTQQFSMVKRERPCNPQKMAQFK